jgi:DNA repair exonuclease SbcCD ATPase subunit
MDRAAVERKLAVAEQRVAEGESHLARQRELIAKTESLGRDLSRPKELLQSFEEAQRLHITDRDRLLRELDVPRP